MHLLLQYVLLLLFLLAASPGGGRKITITLPPTLLLWRCVQSSLSSSFSFFFSITLVEFLGRNVIDSFEGKKEEGRKKGNSSSSAQYPKHVWDWAKRRQESFACVLRLSLAGEERGAVSDYTVGYSQAQQKGGHGQECHENGSSTC